MPEYFVRFVRSARKELEALDDAVLTRVFAHIEALENGNQKQQDRARQHVADQLTQMAPVFTKQKYMLGDEFSMLDVAISPLLWRLDYYGVTLPKAAVPLMKYAERLFSRPAFIEALTPSEKVMRK